MFASNQFMLEALEEAKKAFEKNEVPIGAIIVEDNQIISRSHNQNRLKCDPSAHAEIMALRQACLVKNSQFLENCDIYITIEPCPMCLGALSLARIRRIYFGAKDAKFGALESNPIFCTTNNFSLHKSEIYSGIYESEAILLLQEFFKNKR